MSHRLRVIIFRHCDAYIILKVSDELQLAEVSEKNFITGVTKKVARKLSVQDPRTFEPRYYEIITGCADHICNGPESWEHRNERKNNSKIGRSNLRTNLAEIRPRKFE